MKALRLLLLFLLLPTLGYSQQVKAIETSISIDEYLLFPYYAANLHLENGLNFEIGYVDYPHSTNVHFQSSVRNNSGTLSSIIPIMPDIGNYQKKTRGTVPYLFIGYQYGQDNFLINVQHGWCHDNRYTLKLKPSTVIYRIPTDGGEVQFNLNSQVFISERTTYTFLGYSIIIKLD